MINVIHAPDLCHPVAYISCAMTNTEQRYTQVEKETLGLTWACERFSDYLIGMVFHCETSQTTQSIVKY